MNIALVSPSKYAYSETFIQAHKNLLKGNIFFYYNGRAPTYLEGAGALLGKTTNASRLNRLKYKLSCSKSRFSLDEMMLAKSFKENGIEAVLAEYGMTGAELMPVCKSLKLPLYVYFHGYDAHRKEIIEDYKYKYKALFQFASKIFVVSSVMQEQLKSLGCPEEKLVLNPCAPNDTFFEISPAFTQKKVIAIGRFTDKKAPYFTILAFSKALEKHPEAKLLMAGEGTLFNTCVNLVRYLKIEDNVQFLGIVSPAVFKAHLAESAVFVQHSITALDGDSEGTPVAVLEAQAAGLPVVSTRHAGIADVVLDGKTGYLVEEGDVDGMSERISSLFADLDKAMAMGKEAKGHVRANYSMGKHISLIESAIYS